jgi:hypothetical protein
MNKENGSISVDSNFISIIEKRINLRKNIPLISLFDIIQSRSLFDIQPNTKNPILNAVSPYKVINLSGASYGSFA